MNKNELIAKLEQISSLFSNALEIKRKMNNFVPTDNYERTIVVPEFPGNHKSENERGKWKTSLEHTREDAVEIAKMTFERLNKPKAPRKNTVADCPSSVDAEQKKVKQSYLLKVGIGGIVFFLFMNLMIGHTIGLKIFSWLGVAASAALVVYYFNKLSKAKQADQATLATIQKQHSEQLAQENARFNNAMKEYESQCASYELEKKDFIDKYTAWREIYLAHLKEEDEIAEKLEADKIAAVDKMNEEEFVPAANALEEANDLIAIDYLSSIDVIIDLLRTNRADNLKEAINLYEEICYRERQLELQREQELQRQREEQRRRKDEERRYQEQMQFQKQQEYNRQREAKQQREDEERRHQEEMRQRDQQERDRKAEENRRAEEERQNQLKQQRLQREQASKQRSAAQAQCRACANVGHCNMSIHNDTPNCTGFRPR